MSASLTSSLARLSLRTAPRAPRTSFVACAATAPLIAASCSSVRHASTSSFGPIAIGNLKPNLPKKTMKRLGRGPGSGRGGTSTRGHKGQKARAGNGKPTPGFEGGQTPIMRRYPKRGFVNAHAQDYAVVNVDRLQHWIDRGLLDPTQPITARELHESNCVHGVKDGIKLLGEGAEHLRTPINLIVSRATRSAIAAVEAAGGTIETRYYTNVTLRALVKPYRFEGKLLPRDADPSSKRELIYYSNPTHRGYLAARPTPAPLERKPSSAAAYMERARARAEAAKRAAEDAAAAAVAEKGTALSGTSAP